MLDFKAPDYSSVALTRQATLHRIREPGFDLQALKDYLAENPADFIEMFGMTFDPRNVEIGLPATVPFVLFKRQREFIVWLHERWRSREDGVIEKSRDMGVSWLCVAFAAWMFIFKPNTVVGFGSRKEMYVDELGNPASLFWKLRRFIALLPIELRPKGYDERTHAPSMKLINPENGSSIVGESGDNIGRGNRTSIYFVDEAAFLERPDAVDAALSQTSNCKIHASTPNGEGNPFWRKRFGGKLPLFVFDWRDDPRKGEEWYERQKRTLDPTVIAQEIDRDYSASIGNSFIAGDVVTTAMSRGPADVAQLGPLRAGLDVARYGDDKCVLTLRRGRLVLPQIVWGKTDLMSTAGRVRQVLQSYSGRGVHLEQLAIDEIGVGAGVVDALQGLFPEGVVVGVNVSNRMSDGQHYNLRAYMWAQMREWLPGAVLPQDTDLRADLTGLRYSYRAGELLLESKDDAKKRGMRSPDRGDSLALTFAVPGGPKPKKTVDRSRIVSYEPSELGL